MKRLLVATALALGGCEGAGVSDGGSTTSIDGVLAPSNLPAFFDCLREQDTTVASAHRGGRWADIPENSMQAFETTVQHGPAFLEVDVAQTRDGTLVLMHDDTVDRTTDGHGEIGAMTLDEVQSLQLRDSDGDVHPQHPPTLREALAWADGRTVLELDVKRGVSYEDVVREVDAADAIGRVIFITYSVDGASRLARIAPTAMIYTTIEDDRDLQVLLRRGVALSRVVAWIGDDEFDEALAEALAAHEVEVRYGMFGGAREYETVVGRGIQILAVDDAPLATAIFDVSDGRDGFAALQCVSAG